MNQSLTEALIHILNGVSHEDLSIETVRIKSLAAEIRKGIEQLIEDDRATLREKTLAQALSKDLTSIIEWGDS